MFRKPEKEEFQPEQSRNQVDDLVNRLQREGQIDRLEQELMKFDPAKLAGKERESWYHLFGIVPFQRGNRHLAFERFQEGFRQCPDSASISFSLGQEYEFKADIDNMLFYFDRAKFPQVPAKFALAQSRYAYLWNQYNKALSYVEPLVPVYFELKILDDNFLYIRGMPFFYETWSYLAAFYKLLGNMNGLRSLTEKAESECSEFDFKNLKSELRGIETGNLSDLKERLKSLIDEYQKNTQPTGYASMRYQILQSQVEPNLQDAERALDSIKLGEKDYPWLDDIRLLAKCELAHKAKNVTRENDLQQRFLKKQPSLFEPNIALNFNLLMYQENLKGLYQARRKGTL